MCPFKKNKGSKGWILPIQGSYTWIIAVVWQTYFQKGNGAGKQQDIRCFTITLQLSGTANGARIKKPRAVETFLSYPTAALLWVTAVRAGQAGDPGPVNMAHEDNLLHGPRRPCPPKAMSSPAILYFDLMCILFVLVHVPSTYMEEVRLMTYTAASKKGLIKICWLHLLRAVKLPIFMVYSEMVGGVLRWKRNQPLPFIVFMSVGFHVKLLVRFGRPLDAFTSVPLCVTSSVWCYIEPKWCSLWGRTTST